MDSMTVYYAEPVEIANWLLNKETTLSELQTIDTFAEKAALVDSVVWQKCKDNPQRYLDIYGDSGKYSEKAKEAIRKAEDDAKAKEDDNTWKDACDLNTYKAYEEYRSKFNYQGKHDAEAVKKMDEILRKERERQEEEARAAEARAAEDDLWRAAQAQHTIDAYQTYLDVYPSGCYANEAKNSKKKLLDEKEDLAWNDAIMKDTILSYQSYLGTYPSGHYASQARIKQEEKRQEKKREMIAELEKNPNAYDLDFIKDNNINIRDLHGKIKDSTGQVRNDLLDCWNAVGEELEMGTTPNSIPPGSTEVYFWGIPGSGKTCAMAAILSQAKKMGCFEPQAGPGLRYMMQLSSVFHPEDSPVSILPERTPVEYTQYLPFILNERVRVGLGRRTTIVPHKISIIELSGEIFECFATKVQEQPFPTEDYERTFEHLENYLKDSNNPKYHFFILDSRPNKRQKQLDYLQQAKLYFDKYKVFNENTQGISLIVTKCDTLTKSKDFKTREECAKKYATDTFEAFITSLSRIVGPAGLKLTDGSVPIHPLSIGQVFFQKMCLFERQPAEMLVQTIMDYARTDERENRLNVFNN